MYSPAASDNEDDSFVDFSELDEQRSDDFPSHDEQEPLVSASTLTDVMSVHAKSKITQKRKSNKGAMDEIDYRMKKLAYRKKKVEESNKKLDEDEILNEKYCKMASILEEFNEIRAEISQKALEEVEKRIKQKTQDETDPMKIAAIREEHHVPVCSICTSNYFECDIFYTRCLHPVCIKCILKKAHDMKPVKEYVSFDFKCPFKCSTKNQLFLHSSRMENPVGFSRKNHFISGGMDPSVNNFIESHTNSIDWNRISTDRADGPLNYYKKQAENDQERRKRRRIQMDEASERQRTAWDEASDRGRAVWDEYVERVIHESDNNNNDSFDLTGQES